ncbi:hypothetical protein BU23DRAFT_583772 [Bimuria novae-zelandiae CBS 107.79]|uniref:Acyl-CoA thioesterase-like C-terminal domain-containing protein n=1 Tax=Bimuria novae-zelandiae CBS 107.79 TaxID=1447943 RepID=A0A6A5UXK4_9PLEO|nr:hypothetical protein BU23DRAFT_583772 [Bimuria novae-zelandiae CBS 107.79]
MGERIMRLSTSAQRRVRLPNDICIGAASVSGLLGCVMTKHAVVYASQKSKTKHQTDVRSVHVQFYRPIFPVKDPAVVLHLEEVNIGKAWSTFRVELTYGRDAKLAVSADITLFNFQLPGETLPTNWSLTPPTPNVDLAFQSFNFPAYCPALLTATDPDWACYHPAFYPAGFARGMFYVRYFIPRRLPEEKAMWTNELIQFAIDLTLPVQENLRSAEAASAPIGSLAATLAFAAKQKQLYDDGHNDWRQLQNDGLLPHLDGDLWRTSMINATLGMSVEIKKKLPEAGVRWLYLRGEITKVESSRFDLEMLFLDKSRDLVAIGHQVAWIVADVQKQRRDSSL